MVIIDVWTRPGYAAMGHADIVFDVWLFAQTAGSERMFVPYLDGIQTQLVYWWIVRV